MVLYVTAVIAAIILSAIGLVVPAIICGAFAAGVAFKPEAKRVHGHAKRRMTVDSSVTVPQQIP